MSFLSCLLLPIYFNAVFLLASVVSWSEVNLCFVHTRFLCLPVKYWGSLLIFGLSVCLFATLSGSLTLKNSVDIWNITYLFIMSLCANIFGQYQDCSYFILFPDPISCNLIWLILGHDIPETHFDSLTLILCSCCIHLLMC